MRISRWHIRRSRSIMLDQYLNCRIWIEESTLHFMWLGQFINIETIIRIRLLVKMWMNNTDTLWNYAPDMMRIKNWLSTTKSVPVIALLSILNCISYFQSPGELCPLMLLCTNKGLLYKWMYDKSTTFTIYQSTTFILEKSSWIGAICTFYQEKWLVHLKQSHEIHPSIWFLIAIIQFTTQKNHRWQSHCLAD